VPEATHAQLGQRTPRREAARHVGARVDDARAAREPVRGDAQLCRALDRAIGQDPRALVHAEVDHSITGH
jgi:hypothetical protein